MASMNAFMLAFVVAGMLAASRADDVATLHEPEAGLGIIGVVIIAFAMVIALTSIRFIVHLAKKIHNSLGPVD